MGFGWRLHRNTGPYLNMQLLLLVQHPAACPSSRTAAHGVICTPTPSSNVPEKRLRLRGITAAAFTLLHLRPDAPKPSSSNPPELKRNDVTQRLTHS